jgi:pilus assembly protein CpaF
MARPGTENAPSPLRSGVGLPPLPPRPPVADIYLSPPNPNNEPASAPASAPMPEQAAAEPNGNGVWSTLFPPAPVAARRPGSAVEMPPLGLLTPLMQDQDVYDILINGIQPIYVDIAGQMMDSGLRYKTHEEVWRLAETIMDTIGVRWNPERPLLDTRLPDGSRVNIVAPPMAVDGVTISIRKFPAIHITLDSMIEKEHLSNEMGDFLRQVVANRVNLIVVGGTSSGKTTLLNALSSAISPTERIVTIEDSAELRLQQPHVVRLEAKLPLTIDNPDSAVTIRDLVKNALRMRPDRIIVGESRGTEAFDVIQAMNTGHDGSMTTLHANSPRDALSKLETMVSMAIPQFPMRIVRQQIASTINLVIQMSRTKEGQRRITHVSELSGLEGETFVLQDLILWADGSNGHPKGYRWTGGAARNPNVVEAARSSGMLRGMR